MVDKRAAKHGRVEVLTNYWDKLLGFMQLRASKKKDSKMNSIIKKLYLVPKAV